MAVNIHIQNLNVTPEVFSSVVKDQLAAGADPEVLRDLGYTDVPEGVDTAQEPPPEPDEARYASLEERFNQDSINATARANYLVEVIKHSAPARKMQGFQTNHHRRPRTPAGVDAKHHSEKVMASDSLKS